MSGMKDALLGDTPYAGLPGYKTPGTSKEAAIAIAGDVSDMHRDILRELSFSNLTPDECAGRLRRTVLAIRPRFSELVIMDLIEKTDERRRNESGRAANVYRRKDVKAHSEP